MKQISSNKIKNTSIFTTKSEVLKLLKSKINFSKIEKIFDFTQNQWENNQKQLLDQIVVLTHYYRSNARLLGSSDQLALHIHVKMLLFCL